MIRTILKFGAPELHTKCAPVTQFDETLHSLAEDMLETMYAAPGVGLAATQVGAALRLIVVDVSGGEEKGQQFVLINPEISEQEGQEKGEEGCLSIPGFTAIVERPSSIRVTGKDLEGNLQEVTAEGILARVICHEIDHLDGILYLDRISLLKRDLIKRKIRKLVRAGEW